MKLTRREIREKALQSLFQMASNEELSSEEAIYSALMSEAEEEQEVAVPDYLTALVNGVIAHQETIDKKITAHLKNWTLNRLAKTDLLILRIGAYEILFQEDVPDSVAIDEAIEITKSFSSEKSSKFVNGVLANISKENQEVSG